MNVKMHSDGFRDANPAVNVKVHNWHGMEEAAAKLVANGVPQAVAEKAVEIAWEANHETFWEQAKEDANFLLCRRRRTETLSPFAFSPSLEVYQEGRSGGWLVIHGLPHPSEWNRAQRARWERFENAMLNAVGDLTSAESLLELIEANEWVASIQRRNEIETKVAAYRTQLETAAP